MNELPIVWNKKSGTAMPFSWCNTMRSGSPEKWNKAELPPIKWHSEHCLRENWGAANSAKTRPSGWEEIKCLSEKWNTPGALPDKWGTSGAAVKPHANINFSQKANAANKIISDAAGKAGSTIKNIAGNAVNFIRSEETTNKVRSIKDGALSAVGGAEATFTGLKDKAKAFAAERKKPDDSDIPVNEEVIEDVNSVLAENYTPEEAADTEEVTSTSDYIEEVPEAESFDELYEKAMNSFDEEEIYDEEAANEADDTENCYDSNEVEQPVAAPSVTQTPTPAANSYPQQVYPQSQNGYNPNGNNNVNQYTPQNYSYEEKKKSPVVFILIGVIAVLLVVAGILGGMLLMKNKDNDSDNGSASTTSNIIDSTQSIAETSVIENTTSAPEIKVKGVEFKSQYEEFYDNNLENAPADMEFYNRDIEDAETHYISQTGNVSVALLKGPGSNYEAIFDELIFVEGATTAIIYGENSDWYYIYYHGGAGGGLNYYLGYVEKSKLTEASQNESTVSESTQAQTTDSSINKKDTSDAVKRAITSHLDKEFANEKTQEYFDRNAEYAVYDVNADGIDELFISYDTTASHNTDVYLYKNSDYVLVEQVWEGGISLCLDEHFLFVQQYGGATVTRILKMYDGDLVQTDELQWSGVDYTHNGNYISESEYYNLLSAYETKELIHVWEHAMPVSDMIDMSDYSAQQADSEYNQILYSGYSYIENAPSDMTFFDNSNYNAIPQGIVTTESTGLNLRKGPGTSYDVILEIPKGETVYVYGQNSEWCYVGWEAPTHTADGIYPIYYGYVSSDYLSIGVG